MQRSLTVKSHENVSDSVRAMYLLYGIDSIPMVLKTVVRLPPVMCHLFPIDTLTISESHAVF